jgi:hypothetical protein
VSVAWYSCVCCGCYRLAHTVAADSIHSSIWTANMQGCSAEATNHELWRHSDVCVKHLHALLQLQLPTSNLAL